MDSDEDSAEAAAYEPEYESERIEIASNLSLRILTVVPPPIEFLSRLHTSGTEISGRQVWTGSLLLAQLFNQVIGDDALSFNKQNPFEGRSVLELGSGTGLLGLAIGRISRPACAILSDGDPKAIDLLHQNLRTNQEAEEFSKFHAIRLLWGSEESQALFVQSCKRFCADIWDSNESESVRFDCIVAGDVLYKLELPKLFFATARSLLSESGTLWLCHIPRANVTHEVVVTAATAAGLQVTQVCIDGMRLGHGCPLDDVQRARIYKVSLQTPDS